MYLVLFRLLMPPHPVICIHVIGIYFVELEGAGAEYKLIPLKTILNASFRYTLLLLLFCSLSSCKDSQTRTYKRDARCGIDGNINYKLGH